MPRLVQPVLCFLHHSCTLRMTAQPRVDKAWLVLLQAVSGASKGTGRRSSVKAPAVHATVRNLRSRSVVTTDSQDPEMVGATRLDATVGFFTC